MGLAVSDFSGGIVVDGSADTQRTNECQIIDSFDISPRGQLIVTSEATDYLVLKDNAGSPAPWRWLWALLECAGFNFSQVTAVGEGDAGAGINAYIMNSFNREGVASPLAFTLGSSFGTLGVSLPVLPPMLQGAVVTSADFAGIFPALPIATPVKVRLYLINIGSREGTAPNLAPGLHAVIVTPPGVVPVPFQIGGFDSLGTGICGLCGIPVALGGEGGSPGTKGRQLYFRGVIAYNNFVFGWGYDASDERIATITNITQAAVGANTPLVTTAAAHGYNVGDVVLFKGVVGMTQINGLYATVTSTPLTTTFALSIPTNAFSAYASDGRSIVGNGDGPCRVMFSNLGTPLKWGNDNIAATATDRLFTDSDAIVLGDAGEIIRGAITWGGKLYFGTNKGLHYVSGYGRDSFTTDGATPVMRSYNIVGPHAMIEGPDKHLYGVSDQGLWRLDVSSPYVIPVPPKPLFQQLRDFKGRSNGYWDQIWTENNPVNAGSFIVGRSYIILVVGTTNFTAIGASANTIGVIFTATGVGSGTGTATVNPARYPGVTNQDLIWTAVDWERQQVIIGIPWCSIANGFGFGFDTIVIKYNCVGGGFTRQQFAGFQYTAAGYFRAQAGQAAVRLLGSGASNYFVVINATVQRYGYKATNNATPALPLALPKVRFGPYLPFGPDGDGVVKRLYSVIAWDALGTPLQITGITQANPAVVSTIAPHGFVTGQQVDIYGTNNMVQSIGTFLIVVGTNPAQFSLKTLAGAAVDSTAWTAFAGGSQFIGLPLAFVCTWTMDEQVIQGQIDAAVGGSVVGTFNLSARPVAPRSAVMGTPDASSQQEGDLWLDTSETDQNLGNATAGTNILALNGYLMRVRKDNRQTAVTGVTKANPCVVTAPGHGFFSGQIVSFRSVGGMTQLNNDAQPGPYTRDFLILVVDGDHFSLVGVDSSGFTAYTSGGTVGLAWLLVPGLGGTGNRSTIPMPVVRRPGVRFTLDMNATTLARRFQVEGLGANPGEGESDA